MKTTDQLSLVFGALADATRRDILARLDAGPSTVGALAANYAVSRPAISQHLAVLEKAGLVARTVNAQWREVRVQRAGFHEAHEWIERHRAEWNERFDHLEEHLRHSAKRSKGEKP